MGMAASQARYLALVARKSNCEYEGQQINQSRLVLSNQSANLFNQMLGLDVPVPPSTSDFTKLQYTFKDGPTTYTLDDWKQLASPEEEYNYMVTYHYNTRAYTGREQKLSDPQVQFSTGAPATEAQISAKIKEVTEAKKAWDEAEKDLAEIKTKASTLTNYKSGTINRITACEETLDGDYEITQTNTEGVETKTVFTAYENITDDTIKAAIKTSIENLQKNGVYPEDADVDELCKTVFYVTDPDSALYGSMAFSSDLVGAKSTSVMNQYTTADIDTTYTEYATQINTAKVAAIDAKFAYDEKKADYDSLSTPTYVGNCELTLLDSLDENEAAELERIIADMKDAEITTNIANCFDSQGKYKGGIYKFTYNNVTYYTSFTDLENSYKSGTGINNIDGQIKLPYYNAEYEDKDISETKKALLETDSNGRFTSVRFEDDSIVHTLASNTITDEAGYQDAMNEYNYKSALYEKAVQDINAKTSLIHQEDQQLELRLKQLDTEQNALSTEIDAVTKVIKDNVDKSFKTFGG